MKLYRDIQKAVEKVQALNARQAANGNVNDVVNDVIETIEGVLPDEVCKAAKEMAQNTVIIYDLRGIDNIRTVYSFQLYAALIGYYNGRADTVIPPLNIDNTQEKTQ